MRYVSLLALSVLVAASAYGGGFQVTAQGAKPMGMGLAFTAVADDASAIYYNPAGLAYQNGEIIIGGMIAHNLQGSFTGASGKSEQQIAGYTLVPQLYGAWAFGKIRAGVGVNAPFGLPMRWEDPTTFSGRRVAFTTNLRSININPTVAFPVNDNFSLGFGADWIHSKVQFEKIVPITVGGTLIDVERAKLNGDLADSSAWGWNAGLLWKSNAWRVGLSYRSGVDLKHDDKLAFTQIPTGNAPLDGLVRSSFPSAALDASVPISFPSSLNLGLAWKGNNMQRTTIAFDADHTNWSSFQSLSIQAPSPFNSTRATNWKDTWAWRVGMETDCGGIKCRAGYYRDKTPMPLTDVGPVLPDANRQALTGGIGIGSGRWSVDLAAVYVMFDDRTTTAASTDHLAGTWKTTGSEVAVNVHWR